MLLEIPKCITKQHLLMSNWKLDKRKLLAHLYKMQLGANFIFGALTLSPPQEPQRILYIGLGCGSAMHFLASLEGMNLDIDAIELEPYIIDLARKHFDLEDIEKRENIRIHLADGIAFARAALNKGKQYDAIVVDAAGTSRVRYVPPDAFLAEETLTLFGKLLSPKGILTVNVNSFSKGNLEYLERVRAKHVPHFGTCINLFYRKTEAVLMCSRRKILNWNEDREEYIRRGQQFDKKFIFTLAKAFQDFNNQTGAPLKKDEL